MPARRVRAQGDQMIQVKGVWQDVKLPPVFVNQIFVRGQEDHVFITFGEADLPKELEITNELRQRLLKEGLPVYPVVRLVVTPSILEQFIDKLQVVQQRLLTRRRGNNTPRKEGQQS